MRVNQLKNKRKPRKSENECYSYKAVTEFYRRQHEMRVKRKQKQNDNKTAYTNAPVTQLVE